MMTQPLLLYHAPAAIPYPTNSADRSLLTIRFSSPVRIASIRIAPEGVLTFDNSIGVTYPPRWTGKVFFNVSDSYPVNGLTSCEVVYEECGYELDYPVDMPDGVTTRLVLLESPAERLTISIYGYRTEPRTTGEDVEALEVDSAMEDIDLKTQPEDWSWLWTWAGGMPTLIDLLNDDTPSTTLSTALSCLDLLVDVIPSILDDFIRHPTALPFLLSLPSYPPQRLLQRLYADPTYALHPALKHYLPPSHPLRPLVVDSIHIRRNEAWKRLELGRGALMVLVEEPGDLLETMKGEEKSNLTRLMDLARRYVDRDDEESRRCLELSLDILQCLPDLSTIHISLIDPISRLVVVSRTRGSRRTLPFSSTLARPVLSSLLAISTEVIDGKLTWTATMTLAEPYLPHLSPTDPLVLSLVSTHSDTSPFSPATSFPDTPDGRRLSRLSTALSNPAPSSLIHQVTPAELLSLVAPAHLSTIQRAPIPPIGIPSALSSPTPENQASAWAGKVYTSHEFRKDRSGEGVGVGVSVGLGMAVVPTRASRPASRHVDEYAT